MCLVGRYTLLSQSIRRRTIDRYAFVRERFCDLDALRHDLENLFQHCPLT